MGWVRWPSRLGLLLLLLVVALQFLEELRLGLHHVGPISAAVGAEPLALRLQHQGDAREVEPLDGAQVVVAQDHLAKGDLPEEMY